MYSTVKSNSTVYVLHFHLCKVSYYHIPYWSSNRCIWCDNQLMIWPLQHFECLASFVTFCWVSLKLHFYGIIGFACTLNVDQMICSLINFAKCEMWKNLPSKVEMWFWKFTTIKVAISVFMVLHFPFGNELNNVLYILTFVHFLNFQNEQAMLGKGWWNVLCHFKQISMNECALSG